MNGELEKWHEYYLPAQGKTVLDLGAGCGETAFFYLNHGAKHVISVEPPGPALDLLRRNFGDDPRVTIVPASVDRIKIDIEGFEEGMLVETHFPTQFARVWNQTPEISVWRLNKARYPPYYVARKTSQKLHRLKVIIAHRIRLVLDRL